MKMRPIQYPSFLILELPQKELQPHLPIRHVGKGNNDPAPILKIGINKKFQNCFRVQHMLENIGERVLAPVGRGLLSLAHAFTPAGYVQALKQKIVLAGSPPGYESDRLLVLKVIGAGSALVWIALFFVVLGLSGMLPLVLVAAASAFAFFGPDFALEQRIKERRRRVERALPDMLDLLVISVEAGLGFEQAVDRTSGAVQGPLSEEFRRMLQETRMGASRSDALRALDERTQVDDLRMFVLAMLQADSFGISIANILNAQADEIRIRRRLRALR